MNAEQTRLVHNMIPWWKGIFSLRAARMVTNVVNINSSEETERSKAEARNVSGSRRMR